jgi:FkbM family methyltransferase
MLNIIAKIARASEAFRRRYGTVAGFVLWFRLRQHVRAQRGALHKVCVPGLRHPVFVRAQTSDVLVFIQIFVDGELEFSLPQKPSSIVDAGANIGLASIYFANRFPSSIILALEVEESNFELLKRNASFYPNITCVRKALWSGPAYLTIVNPMGESWAFRVGTSTSDNAASIPAVGVKELVQEFEGHRIDLLKIDIEGAEKEVFKNGMDQWINQVGTIAVELHDNIEPGCRNALVEGLKGLNRSMHQLGEYTIVTKAV